MTKDVIRFFRDSSRKRLILSGITEEQAQQWCESPYSREILTNINVLKGKRPKWFDGYVDSGFYCPRQKPKYTHYFVPTEQV